MVKSTAKQRKKAEADRLRNLGRFAVSPTRPLRADEFEAAQAATWLAEMLDLFGKVVAYGRA